MARSILVSWAFSRYVFQRHDGIRVRITVSCQEGFKDDKLFAYRLLTTNPTTGRQEGFFSHVCSPTDMEDYGAEEPIIGMRPEWFRLNYVDVLLRSMEEVNAFVDDVLSDVRRLKTTLDTMDTLQDPTELVLGLGCQTPTPDSSSEASSPSSEALPPFICELLASPRYSQSIGFGAAWAGGDGVPCLTTVDPGGATALLTLQYFDLTELPEDAIVTGMKLSLTFGSETESSSAWDGNDVKLSSLRLYHPDLGPVGTDWAATDVAIEPGTTVEFGDQDTLWDGELTEAILANPLFGVGLTCKVPLAEGQWGGDCLGSYSPSENNPSTIRVTAAVLTLYYRCYGE